MKHTKSHIISKRSRENIAV